MRNLLRNSINNFSTIRGAKTVGFIGLGNMGGPMAINLATKGGYNVLGLDTSKDRLKELSQKGVQPCENIKQMASKTDVFITMLPSHVHVSAVCEGKDGLFTIIPKDSLIIDCSTINPKAALKLHESGNKFNVNFVDSPVSGGVGAATAGTLTFMVGAPNTQIFDRASQFLKFMGKNMINCETPSMGQVAKCCNNMALAIEMIATSEALSLGKKLGLDPKILTKIINISSGRCWTSEVYNPCPGVMEKVPSSNNYNGGFASELMLKDCGIAIEAAKEVSANVPLGSHAKSIYENVVKQGYNRKDFSVVFDLLMKNKI